MKDMNINYIYLIIFSFFIGFFTSYYLNESDGSSEEPILKNINILEKNTKNNCDKVATDKSTLSEIKPQKVCEVCEVCENKITYIEEKSSYKTIKNQQFPIKVIKSLIN